MPYKAHLGCVGILTGEASNFTLKDGVMCGFIDFSILHNFKAEILL